MFIEGFCEELEKLSGNWSPNKPDTSGIKGIGDVSVKKKAESAAKFKPFLQKSKKLGVPEKKQEFFRFE